MIKIDLNELITMTEKVKVKKDWTYNFCTDNTYVEIEEGNINPNYTIFKNWEVLELRI